jgi:two-component system sensor histidine kinase TctE
MTGRSGVAALYHESIRPQTRCVARNCCSARELARLAERSTDGAIRVSLSPSLEQVFHAPGTTDLFVIRSDAGALLATSRPEFAASMDSWPLGGSNHARSASSISAPAARSIAPSPCERRARLERSRSQSRALDEDALAHTVLDTFVYDITWAILLFAAAILVVGVWSIRRGLRPLRAVSARAATITTETTGVRLADARLPSELSPLVATFDQALDRLERGLISQREFTANAAHQLRTPLAILTAQLDKGSLRNN